VLIGNISRDDKRYTEKKNKSERARRKKEDIAKIRGLVDMTLRWVLGSCSWGVSLVLVLLLHFSLDPRIKRIKQQEKDARIAKKRAIAPAGPVEKTKQEEEEAMRKVEEEAKLEEDKVCHHIH